MSEITVRITGVGHSAPVVVENGASVGDALDAAGIDADGQGLNASVNNARVEDPSVHTLRDGDQIIVVPRSAKLG